MTDKPQSKDEENVEFLSGEFGVTPQKAAELLTQDSEKAAELATKQLEKEHESDALEHVPTAAEPEREWLGPSDSHMQKPVLHEDRKTRNV